MDTMTYKHEKFFGPIAAKKYQVSDQETFQKNWEDINLYSKTRGVNRFVGLVKGLESVGYEGIDNLKRWVEETSSLSNDSLGKEVEKTASKDLELALEWSKEVNQAISEAEGHDQPFEGAKEALAKLDEVGTVYVVSSANRQAVEEEWTRHGLIDYVEDLYCQDRGKKEDVIKSIITNGADPSRIMMVGDSPGDLDAAQQNDVWFYPIIVGNEKRSWEHLSERLLDTLLDDKFTNDVQEDHIRAFWSNLEN